jgi:non-canonical purine NTP pyrophosphatase (RdgB/HAM1 family)
MAKKILFSSTNKGKIQQFQYVADYYKYDVTITSVYKEHPEITAYNEDYPTQQEIVENGAREIYQQIKQPIIVEDTIFCIDALGGKPGLTANDYLKEKGRQGILEEMKGIKNRKAQIISIVCFYDGELFVSFKNVVHGEISKKELYKEGEPIWVGPTLIPFGGGFNAIFVSNKAKKTIAELTAEQGLEYGYREPNFKAVLNYILKK